MITGIANPSTIMCRGVHITSDIRYFVYLERYNAPANTKYMSIVEVYGVSGFPYVISIRETVLQIYNSNLILNTFFNIFETTSLKKVLIYSTNAYLIEGQTTANPFNVGYLLKTELESWGSQPVVKSFTCGATATFIAPFSFSPIYEVPNNSPAMTLPRATFDLIEDDGNYVYL